MADVQLNFGRFIGSYVSQVPSYYLWYLVNNAYEAHVRQSADDEWKYRNRMNTHWLLPKFKRFS